MRRLIGIHTNRYEVLVDELDEVGCGVGGFVHLVAPIAPDGGDTEQNRFVVAGCVGESLRTPDPPLDIGSAIRSVREPKLLSHYGGAPRRVTSGERRVK